MSIVVREANKFDKPQIIEMLWLFRDESPIKQHKTWDSKEYVGQLLDNIIAGQGIIFIADNIGIVIGIKTPSIWDNTKIEFHELAWFVKKEHRHKTIGYRLFKAYINYAKQLKDEGKIALYTITKMTTSPDINYGKYGFTKIEENWMNND